MKKLSAWAETLQNKSNKAFDYSQPQDAYADVEGKPLQRWSATTGSPSAEAADAASLKSCETGKAADAPPCVVYRIASDAPTPGGAFLTGNAAPADFTATDRAKRWELK